MRAILAGGLGAQLSEMNDLLKVQPSCFSFCLAWSPLQRCYSVLSSNSHWGNWHQWRRTAQIWDIPAWKTHLAPQARIKDDEVLPGIWLYHAQRIKTLEIWISVSMWMCVCLCVSECVKLLGTSANSLPGFACSSSKLPGSFSELALPQTSRFLTFLHIGLGSFCTFPLKSNPC